MYLNIAADTREGQALLQRVSHRIPEAMKLAMGKFLKDIIIQAFPKVPRKTGVLENSGFSRLDAEATGVKGVVGFEARSKKGFNYAPIQNWNEEFNHPIKGQAHYLDSTVEEHRDKWKDYVIDELKLTFS